jgi:hypothetical protein
MNWRAHIDTDPAVCHGKACIKGTRSAAGHDAHSVVQQALGGQPMIVSSMFASEKAAP